MVNEQIYTSLLPYLVIHLCQQQGGKAKLKTELHPPELPWVGCKLVTLNVMCSLLYTCMYTHFRNMCILYSHA